MHQGEDLACRVETDFELRSKLHEYLTGDASRRLMTDVLEERMQRKPRQRAITFGLIWKRSRMSWLQWDGVVDLMSEHLNQMLGVDGDLCVVPPAGTACAMPPLHFTTRACAVSSVARRTRGCTIACICIVSTSGVETAAASRHTPGGASVFR